MVPVLGLVSSSGCQKPKLQRVPKYRGQRAELCLGWGGLLNQRPQPQLKGPLQSPAGNGGYWER